MAISNSFPPHDNLRINRRDILRTGGLSAGLAGFSNLTARAKVGASVDTHDITIREATNVTIAPSPNGKLIVFDLLGLLWLMPADGGDARCLTDAYADAAYPCWSPDGKNIAFQSYRSGNFHIWIIKPDGTALKQLTTGLNDHREPCFSPSGREILFSSDRSGRYAIHKLNLDSGDISQLSYGESQDSEPCIAPNGRQIAFIADGLRLMRQQADGSSKVSASVPKPKNWTRPSGIFAPSFSPDGRLSYITIVDDLAKLHIENEIAVSGEDIYPFRTGWFSDGTLAYGSSGKLRRKDAKGTTQEIPFTAKVPVSQPSYKKRKRDFTSKKKHPVVGVTSPVLSPDGGQIAFGALNDIYILTIGDPTPTKITTGSHAKCHPAWSPNGKFLAYSSDISGAMEIWIYECATGKEYQLTHLKDAAALFSCWSPDSSQIAFLNQYGALHMVEIATGEIAQIYDPLWLPGRPSFSPDGQKIALAAFKPVSGRFREGLSEILIIDLATGNGNYTPIVANKSIATRGEDGPHWSPDGKYFAYVFASTLWIQPIATDGSFTGPARQISNDVTDAPSWSGDSGTLSYLSNGKLQLVAIDGSKPSKIPFSLHWARVKTPEPTVIHGARIWDALDPDYKEGDVVLNGNRISEIVPPGSVNTENMRKIDGTDLTLMPGLIDMHTHRQISGAGYGDRMGRALLAMGITATRSPGGAAYLVTEDKEAIDAGLRVAPRHFAAGEALDGNRIYYNFMRPVTEPGQIDLELSRAKALGYDMIKTYVRMDNRAQAEVINAAHRINIPVSSHYHYPALRFGADGVEHLGATSRFGYSRTITRLGAGYEDVNTVFAAAKAGRTPTLFAANALLPEYPDLIADPRIRTLLPAWDLMRLDTMAKMIGEEDREPLFKALKRNVEQIKAMMAEGWHVHTGTDAPIDTIGISYHLNLRAMTHFGISPYEALLTATRHAGSYLNAPIGTIAPGQLADLILVDGDPISNIADVSRVNTVIRDGGALDVSALLLPYKIARSEHTQSHIHSHTAHLDGEYFWHSAEYLNACRTSCCSSDHITTA